MAKKRQGVELGIKRLRAEVGDHIAYFWETEAEFLAALGFLELGIRRGEHVVVFGHADANERVLAALNERGHPVGELERDGALSVLGPEPAGDQMLGRIGATFQKAIEGGAPMIRLLGNIGWGHPEWPSDVDILRFEAKITAAAARFPCVVVCMYDVNHLTGSVVLHGAMGTHPLTIYHNLVRENPMCLHVDEYLARLEAGQNASSSG